MELSFNFELAVYSAWLLAMGTLVGLTLWAPAVWQMRRVISVPRPRREALLSLAAAALLVALSVVTDQLLRPWKKDPQFGAWVFLATGDRVQPVLGDSRLAARRARHGFSAR